jgi:hypothetical protein
VSGRRRIQAVGLRQLACGASKGAHLARVDHRHRQASRGEADLQAAGCLEHDQRWLKATQALDQCGYFLLVVVDGEALAGGAETHIKPMLGNINADERGSLVHDPVSLDAG